MATQRLAQTMSEVTQDAGYGLRLLHRSPGFAAVAVLSLALTIGLTTAIAGIVDAWIVRPLPFADADRLAIILRNKNEQPDTPSIFPLYRDYVHWTRESRSFTRMGGAFWRSYLVADAPGASAAGAAAAGGGVRDPEEIDGMIVTDGLFGTLGVRAAIGRIFSGTDVGRGPQVMLGYEFWQRRFGGSSTAIGTTIALNGTPHEIVGVVPPGLGLRILNRPGDLDLYTLLQPGEPSYGPDDVGAMAAIGRVKPGVTLAAAREELSAIQRRVDAKYPTNPLGFGVHLAWLQEDNTRTVRASLSVLAAGAACVLLIACANVASLLLGRGTARRKEIAVRAALGSTRRRLMRQLVTESALLSLLAVAIGIGVAYAGVRVFVALNPFDLLPQNPIAIDGRVLACTAAIAMLTTLIVGVAPALQVSRVDVQEVLKDAARGSSGSASTQRWRSLLVMAEIAVCVLLLTGAALLIATLDRLRAEPLGFNPDRVTTIELMVPGSMAAPARLNDFYGRLLERLRVQPGVEAAAIAGRPLYVGTNTTFTIEGAPDAAADRALGSMLEQITPDYFAALEIPVRAGRLFDRTDIAGAEPVVVINEAVVRLRFNGQNPVGRRIRLGDNVEWRTIVGIVGDTRSTHYNTLAYRTEARIYTLTRQPPTPKSALSSSASKSSAKPAPAPSQRVYVYVKGRAPGAPAMREIIASLGVPVPVKKIVPLRASVEDVWQQPRLRSIVLATFAVFALVFAVTGLYAVTAQWVALRVHELGIRTALGAQGRDLLGLVLRQGMTLAIGGVAIGLVAALALARTMASLLYGVRAADPGVLAGVSMLLLAAAALGCYVPARSAARIDPLSALRHD